MPTAERPSRAEELQRLPHAPTLPFATYFPAILVAALFAGSFAGLLALALSIFVVWWAFTPPYYEFAALTLPQVANVVLFSFSAGLIVWLAAVYRRLLNDMRQHEKQRDLLVGEIQHLSRNILTVVEFLIHQTIPETDRARSLINRIRAVVKTQDLLDASGDRTVAVVTMAGAHCPARHATHFAMRE